MGHNSALRRSGIVLEEDSMEDIHGEMISHSDIKCEKVKMFGLDLDICGQVWTIPQMIFEREIGLLWNAYNLHGCPSPVPSVLCDSDIIERISEPSH